MQQTCSKCGAVATAPSKFCRNCGGPLIESPMTEAPTQQYGRQTPAREVPPTSSPFSAPVQPPPPSVADAFTPDTARLHGQQTAPPGGQPFGQAYGQPYGQPPMPAAYQPGNPIPYAMQPPPKSNWWKWLLGFALASLLICGGLLSYAFMRARDAVPEVQRQVTEAIQKAQEEAERAAKEAGAPGNVPGVPGVPAPPPPPGEMPQSLEQLRYPNSEEVNKVDAFGQQVLSLTTADSVDVVKAYYEKRLGQTAIQSQEKGRKAAVFFKAPYMVTVGTEGAEAGVTSITLVRSSLIPQVNPKQYQ